MELSKLKIEVRNKLYYNKFQYKAVCGIQGAAYTYYTNDIETFITRIERLKENNNPNRYGVRTIDDKWKVYWEEVNIDRISQFLTWRNVVDKDKCMYRIQGDTVSFFSNDLSLLETLGSIDPYVTITKAEQLNPQILYFKKQPKHHYRTFFKGKRCPERFHDSILEFSERYPNVKISRSLLTYARTRRNPYSKFIYMHGSYHIDYNDASMLSLLHLLFPGMIAKTYSLAKQP
jgi:hypothetical protein